MAHKKNPFLFNYGLIADLIVRIAMINLCILTRMREVHNCQTHSFKPTNDVDDEKSHLINYLLCVPHKILVDMLKRERDRVNIMHKEFICIT